MENQYWERNRKYRRGVLAAVPAALVVFFILFVAADHVSIEEIEKFVGFQGPMQVLPDITIVPDNQSETLQRLERSLTTMATVDIDLPDGKTLDQRRLVDNPRDDNTEKIDFPELDDYVVTTPESRRDVPYSEDYVILKMVEPKYPPRELKMGLEGSVLVELFVGESGRVEQASVLSRFGPPSFELASLNAVRQFVFQPPRKNGEAASMWIKFMIKFRIFS